MHDSGYRQTITRRYAGAAGQGQADSNWGHSREFTGRKNCFVQTRERSARGRLRFPRWNRFAMPCRRLIECLFTDSNAFFPFGGDHHDGSRNTRWDILVCPVCKTRVELLGPTNPGLKCVTCPAGLPGWRDDIPRDAAGRKATDRFKEIDEARQQKNQKRTMPTQHGPTPVPRLKRLIPASCAVKRIGRAWRP